MKKAKIMLASIAVLAIVGSALAFKGNTLDEYHFAPARAFPANVPITLTGHLP